MNQALNFCGRGEISNKVSDLIKKRKCNKCNDYMSLIDKNVSMNGKRFDVKQKYISRPMILSNQATCFLGYKHRMNQALNFCGREEISNKVSDFIKKGKCNKCNDYMSLGNDNMSTYVVHNNNEC